MDKVTEVVSVKVEVAEKTSETIDPNKLDHGMSEEDQEMYTIQQ